MTDKEKAKAYDNALERARNIRFGNPQSATANTVCEEIFPELKESKDEKIRKAIVEFFELQEENTTYSFVTRADILAWLEKQVEQKPNWSEEDERIVSMLVSRCNGTTYTSDNLIKMKIWLKSIKERMKGENE